LLPVDDSIVRIINDEVMILSSARGYAPLPIHLPDHQTNSLNILALGGQLKNTVAIKIKEQVFLSQHLGNLETAETLKTYQQTITHWQNIYNFRANLIACDAHPDYYSSHYAQTLQDDYKRSLPIIQVQHHLAHIFSTIAEHNLQYPLLGISWDGTGYGLDNTIWGGEFFYITEDKIQRVASFLPFYLLGGNKAIVEPKRIALSLLLQVFNHLENIPEKLNFLSAFTPQELNILTKMYHNKINSPLTSSVGRLFDGISALLGIIEQVTYEGEAAMRLEFIANDLLTSETYPFAWTSKEDICSYIDWKPMIKNIINDYINKKSLSLIAAKFHQTLVAIIVKVAQNMPSKNIVLAGGCFQNKYLLKNTINTLKKYNLSPYYSQKIPINDGGLALGQIAFASQYPERKQIQFD
jgi:hydrogenase maturation protein HypF